jgi:large subunit ribosomal protein L5
MKHELHHKTSEGSGTRAKIATSGISPERTKTIRAFLEKIVVNAGVGRASQAPNFEEKLLPQILRDIAQIAGQKPRVTRAKRSVAGFKVREGQIVGVYVTLRGSNLVDFFERFHRIVLPRVRDFGGVDVEHVDAHGTLNVGFREQVTFPEVNPEESPFVFPLGVSLVPHKRNRAAALETFRALGVPFKE